MLLKRQTTATPSAIDSRTNNFISGASWVSREFLPNSALNNRSFNIVECLFILSHFLKEMRDRKFVITIMDLLSDTFDDRQARLSMISHGFGCVEPYEKEVGRMGLGSFSWPTHVTKGMLNRCLGGVKDFHRARAGGDDSAVCKPNPFVGVLGK